MNERIAWDLADDVHPLPDDQAVAGNLWTRCSALALTAGFFAVSAAPARAAFVQAPAPRASHIVVSKSNRVLALMAGEKTLKRYARVHLERGQSEVVRFELGPDDLTFIGRDNRPITEPGEFEVMVGSSSRNEDLLKARFTLLA